MSISKEELRKEFSKEYEKYYRVELFEKEGFKRHQCKICGKYFWSIEDRDICGDPAHNPYSFFKEKPNNISYIELWKRMKNFFEENRHAIIKRYPVVSRWRQDLYFTIAGIQDFQRIEGGKMTFEYPANPLLVPQICLRFNDIGNVGVTGRHFTSFMMANQTAFDWPQAGYWRDETIRLNFEFLTKVMNIKKEDIIYHEDVWAMPDFSEFGPSLETFSKGLELVNSVFTQFEYINNEIRELKSKVVDVGWGFERLLWYYTGLSTAYEATFFNILKKIEKEINLNYSEKQEVINKFFSYSSSLDAEESKNLLNDEINIIKRVGITKEDFEKVIRPLQAIYGILDHVRTLLFAITDGALPSNIGGGYNLRVILRRSLDFIERYSLNIDLKQIARLIAEDLKELYPELMDNFETFDKVIDIEKERYEKAKIQANKIIETYIKENKITKDTIKKLYESYGVTPELIERKAKEMNRNIEISDEVYEEIIESIAVKEEKKEKKINIPDLEPTKPIYYETLESDSKVIYAKNNIIVLDKTPFYPEGGGQKADQGFIDKYRIIDVQRVGNVIVHIANEEVSLKEGSIVHAKVDKERRDRLMAHHTATHLISAASRKILGPHAWQEGAMKDFDKAHIDVAHYDKISEEELKRIEDLANNWILNGIKVKTDIMQRGEAEAKYGFSIYQGHGVPAKELRIVVITDLKDNLIDAEACGGTHVNGKENMLGIIKIINSYRLHDGVDRIEFVAGKAALEYFQKENNIIKDLKSIFNSKEEEIIEKAKSIVEDNKELNKKIDEYESIIIDKIKENIKEKERIEIDIDLSEKGLRKLAHELVNQFKNSIVIVKSKSYLVCGVGPNRKESAIEIAKEFKGFKVGGSKSFAEGRADVNNK